MHHLPFYPGPGAHSLPFEEAPNHIKPKAAKMLERKKGINLNIGCGEAVIPNYLGMDKRPLKNVDIVHDLEVFPYPLPDACCHNIVGSHIIEHIKPWLMIELMDELWRIMKPKGALAFSLPYAGSPGFWQDPTHCNGCNEATWQYFDPEYPLYQVYKPKPWKIEKGFPVWQATGNMEVMLIKREEKSSRLKTVT